MRSSISTYKNLSSILNTMSITGKRRGNIHCAVIVILMLLINLLGSSKAWAVAGNYFSQNYEADGVAPDWSTSVAGRFTPVILEENGNHYLCVNQDERNNNGCVLTSTSLQGKVAAGTDFVLQFDLKISSSTNKYPVSFEIFDEANSAVMFSLTATGTWATTWIINGSSTQVTLPGSNAGNGSQTIADVTWYNVKVSRYETHTYLTITNKSTGAVVFDRSEVETKSTTGGLGKMVFTTSRYLANFALDNIVVTPYSRTYEYSKGTVADVNGTLPTGGTVEHGSKVTMPATNSILYKSGYTLTGYKSSIDNETYAFGTDVSVTDDVTFTTVFNANNVVRTDVINTVNASWSNVALADGAAEKWYVSQSLFNGESQDVALKAEGKSITFEAVTGMKLLLPTSKADDFTSTADFDKDGYTWTYTGAAGNVTVTYTGDDDISETFTVTYPMTSKPVYKTNLNDEYNALLADEVKLTVDMYNMETGTYQWYKTATGDVADGVAIANATTATYTAPTTEHGTSYYYCIGTNSIGSVASKVAAVNVNGVPIVATDIAKNSYEVLLDAEVTMSVVVRNMTAPQSAYQWYSNTTASTEGGTAISGANAASYTAPTTADGTIYYYCVAENVYGKDTSKVARVTVNGKPIVGNNIAKKAYALSVGDELTLAITVKNMQAAGAAYQWYVHTADTTLGTPIAGATSASYTVPTAEISNKYYYCVATNPFGSDTTIVAQVNVADYVTLNLKNWPADDVVLGQKWIWGSENNNWTDKSPYTLEDVEFYESNDVVYSPGIHVLIKGWYTADDTQFWGQQPLLYPYGLAGYLGGTFGEFSLENGKGLHLGQRERPVNFYNMKAGDVMVVTGSGLTDDAIWKPGLYGNGEFNIYVNADGTESTVVCTADGCLSYWLHIAKGDYKQTVIESVKIRNKYAPTITTDLGGQTYTIGRGETKTLTVAATATDANPLSYHWYRNDIDSIKGGTAIDPNTNPTAITASLTTLPNESYYYYCVISNSVTGAAVATTKTVHVQCKPQVTYACTDADVVGILPPSEIKEIGEQFTIEASNQLLFKEGYTITAWTDSTNTYDYGQSYDIVNDITLYPVFRENEKQIDNITKNTDVTWQFGTSNAAPAVTWNDGEEHYLVTQTAVIGETQDLVAKITTDGFDNTTASEGCASVAAGTKVALKVKYGTIITVYAKEGETPSGTITAADYPQEFALKQNGNVLSYTYTGDEKEAVLTLSAAEYEKIAVRHVPSGIPVFSINPEANYYSEVGKDLTMTIDVTSNTVIQWYKNTTNSTTGGVPVEDANGESLTVRSDIDGTEYYYVTATNRFGTTTSTVARVDYFSYETLDFQHWDAADADVFALTGKAEWDIRGGYNCSNWFYPYDLSGYLAARFDQTRVRSGYGYFNYGSGGRPSLILGMKKGQHVIMTCVKASDLTLFPEGRYPDDWWEKKNQGAVVTHAGTYNFTINDANNQVDFEMLTDGNLFFEQPRSDRGQDATIRTITLPSKYRPVITKDLNPVNVVDKDDPLTLKVEAKLPVEIAGHSLAYQWYTNTTNSNKGGTAIEGATEASYTIANVDSAAYYYCLVYNAATNSIRPTTPAAVGFYVHVTFENNDNDAYGEAPAMVKVQSGLPLTIPVNQTLYKNGYTLTGWTDGDTIINVGTEYIPLDDVVMHPVFTKNNDDVSLAKRGEAMTVIWKFSAANGSAEYNGNESANVNQVTINSEVMDLGIKMTGGDNQQNEAFASRGWMAAEGANFYLPVVKGAKVSITLNNPAGITINGNEIAYSSENGSTGNVVYTYTCTTNAAELLLNVGNNYIKDIQIEYPAPEILKTDAAEYDVTISGGKIVRRSAVITLTGRNLTPGAEIPVALNNNYVTISPQTVTVASNGTVNQQLLVTYAQQGVQQASSTKVTFTYSDDVSAEAIVNVGRTEPFTGTSDVTAVSNKTTWDWSAAASNVTPEKDVYMAFCDATLEEGAAWPTGMTAANLAGAGTYFVNSSTRSFDGTELYFKTTRKGTVEVEFASIAGTESITLAVNGENTSYTTSGTSKVTTAKIPVPAGGVLLQARLAGQSDGERNMRVYKITFKPDAEEPEIIVDPSTATFTLHTTDMELADDDPNKETLYYTIDGTEPTINSDKYNGEPVAIYTNCTIKAIAYAHNDGKNKSSVAELTTELPTYKLHVNMYPSMTYGRIEVEPESEGMEYLKNAKVTIRGFATTGYSVLGWTKTRNDIATGNWIERKATYVATINDTDNTYYVTVGKGEKGTVNYDIANAIFLDTDGNAYDETLTGAFRNELVNTFSWNRYIKTPIATTSIAAPSNYPLHTSGVIEGNDLDGSVFTLQYWQDTAGNKYDLGTSSPIETEGQEITLVPVYKQNLLSTFMETRNSKFDIRWDFRRSYGAHPLTIPSGVDKRFYSTHAKMSYTVGGIAQNNQVVDLAIKINTEGVETTPEAFTNEDVTEWATMKSGVKITLPSAYHAKFTLASWEKLSSDGDGTTINGQMPDNIHDEVIPRGDGGCYLYTWTMQDDDATAELVIGDDYSYYKYIEGNYQDAEKKYLKYSANNTDMGTVTAALTADPTNHGEETEQGYAFDNSKQVTVTAERNDFYELKYWLNGEGTKIYPDGTYETANGSTGSIGSSTSIDDVVFNGFTAETDNKYTLTLTLSRFYELQAVFGDRKSYYVNFTTGEGNGLALPQMHIEHGNQLEMPLVNYNLFLEGHTLKYYTDYETHTKKYEFGKKYDIDSDLRLVPVFEPNKVSTSDVTSVDGCTVTWNMANALFNFDEATGRVIAPLKIDNDTIDVQCYFSNSGTGVYERINEGVCEVSAGSVFEIPTTGNCVINVVAAPGTSFSKGDIVINGANTLEGATVSVDCTTANNAMQIQFVNPAKVQSVSVTYKPVDSDVTLKTVSIGSYTLTNDEVEELIANKVFNYSYSATTLYENDAMPEVKAEATEGGSTTVTQATVSSGKATILLKVNDVTLQTYNINFTLTDKVAPTVSAIAVNESAAEEGIVGEAQSQNGVISITFDHTMTATDIAGLGQTLGCKVDGKVLKFTYWNLAANQEYTLNIPANTLSDIYGVKNASAIEVKFTTSESSSTVQQGMFNFVVTHKQTWDGVRQLTGSRIAVVPDAVIKKLKDNNILCGTIEEAIDSANAAKGTERFYIFVPNAEYNMKGNSAIDAAEMGTTMYGKDDNGNFSTTVSINVADFEGKKYYVGRSVLTRDNVSIIGQSQDGTVIYNDPRLCGAYTSATLRIGDEVKNTYMQDLTLENRFCNSQGNKPWSNATHEGGGAPAIYDNGTHTIAKNVSFKAHDFTHVTTAWVGNVAKPTSVRVTDNYYEDCALWGTRYMLYDQGQAWWERPTVVMRLNSDRANTFSLLEHYQAEQPWGYVLANGKVIAESDAAKTRNNNQFILATRLRNSPALTWINMKFDVLPSAAGYDKYQGTGGVIRLHEYNSMTASGTPLDLSQRSLACFAPEAGSDVCVLTSDQKDAYNVQNVLGGNEAYDPRVHTVQANMNGKDLRITTNNDGKTQFDWDAVSNAMCYFVFRIDKQTNDTVFYEITTHNYCVPDQKKDAGYYFVVRAANERGGLGSPSKARKFEPLDTYVVEVKKLGSAPDYYANGEWGWSTVCLPVNATFDELDGFNVYAAVKLEGNTLMLKKVKKTEGMRKNRGYIIYAKPGQYNFYGTYTAPMPLFSAVNGDDDGYSLLDGNPEAEAVTVGTLNIYTLSYKPAVSGIGFYKFVGSEIPARKAYLRNELVDGPVNIGYAPAKGLRFVIIDDDEWEFDPTDISGVKDDENEDSNAVFDLSGKQVDPSQMRKGMIYIVNGKKVVY